MLLQNTSQHENIRPVHGALWQDESGVELKRETSGGWSTSTVPSRSNGGVPSWRIEELLRQFPRSRVLILKLDIEGSERQVCDASPQTIRAAPCVIVEPHDYDRVGAGCLTPLYRAISGKEVDTLVQGDVLVFLDSSLCSPTGNLRDSPGARHNAERSYRRDERTGEMGLRASTQLGPLVASAPSTSESNRATSVPAIA